MATRDVILRALGDWRLSEAPLHIRGIAPYDLGLLAEVAARAVEGRPEEVSGHATGATLDEFLTVVREERARQDRKWGIGTQRDPHQFLAILVEEVGEVAKALLERETTAELLAELVQVAAVCAKFAEWGIVLPFRAAPVGTPAEADACAGRSGLGGVG